MSDKEAAPQGTLPRCGAAGAEHGPVVGCCHQCGLILCTEHVYHQTRSRLFGRVDAQAAFPLACGEHRGRQWRKGLPPTEQPRRRRVWRWLQSRPPRPRHSRRV